MAAQVFLTEDEFFELLQAELPASVYAEDDATHPDPALRSVSSSELRAAARMLAEASVNLSSIYDDKFISTSTASGLTAYEKEFFETAQDASQDASIRKQNVVSKIRATGGINYAAIYSIAEGVLGSANFDMLASSGQLDGAWRLGISHLGARTYVAELDPIRGAVVSPVITPLDCARGAEAASLTAEEVAAIERTAYLYRIRIYGNASQATLNLLENRLTTFEPARSSHLILNNETPGPADEAAYRAATPEFERLRLA